MYAIEGPVLTRQKRETPVTVKEFLTIIIEAFHDGKINEQTQVWISLGDGFDWQSIASIMTAVKPNTIQFARDADSCQTMTIKEVTESLIKDSRLPRINESAVLEHYCYWLNSSSPIDDVYIKINEHGSFILLNDRRN